MLKKLVLSFILVGLAAVEGFSAYSWYPYGVLSVRRVSHLNGVPYLLTYDVHEYYGGSNKGFVTLYSPSSTTSIFNYADLKNAITDFDNVYNGYGKLNYLTNSTATASGTTYWIRNKDSFEYGTMK